ncbi:phospholipid carrier-dependent glycosyltransferase [Flavobacterium sp. Sd200]|uniref:glycosyltransferase family 39 protein n=1 Tax=Flavobacterium sp. Sd200 TaxID=2692211 RepID=UPI00136AF329|nr:glycosyltransferase family 39 protein [Flavobacterium sp. Sd200]MXN92575.1 phospholipid carrier-dependent glycosyltransferase [Flavobacterium sp. Sd200]
MKVLNWLKDNYILAALIALAFIMRLYKLDFQSPWGDELFTLLRSDPDKSISEVLVALKGDAHPKLYYLLVHFFQLISGSSVYTVRFISVLFGVGGIVALYYLGKELFNKNTALLAVFFLTINHFHISYSQEARMYSMLLFTTALSFLFLVRFIKNATLRTALLYSLTTALLVNTHLFGLFALFAQYLIILYFIFFPYNTTGKKLFTNALISAFITFICFIPSILTLQDTGNIKSFWIPIPEPDVFSKLFSQLLGPETCVAIALLAIAYFCFTVFKQKEQYKYAINPEQDKNIFAFQVLATWIFIVVFLPFILSYIHLPMMVDRYFINILPPVILFITAGIFYIQSNTVKITLVGCFILFSLSDLLLVKDYYNKVEKTQFREAANYIKENHNNTEKIYSYNSTYFSYYLKENEGHAVTQESMSHYVSGLINNGQKPESFWYTDVVRGNDALPSKSISTFLDSLYIVDKSLELNDVFVKHYNSRSTYKAPANFTKFKPYKDRNGDNLNYSFEIYNDMGAVIELSGWAFFDKQSTKNCRIAIVLIADEKEVVLDIEPVTRYDVTSYFKSEYDLSQSGFKLEINKKALRSGIYKVAIYVADETTKKDALNISDKVITIN